MISFPSSFQKGGASMQQEKRNKYSDVPTPNESVFENIQTKNLKLTPEIINAIYTKDHDFSNFTGYFDTRRIPKNDNKTGIFEDPFKMDEFVYRGMNTYRFMYKNTIKQFQDAISTVSNGDQGTKIDMNNVHIIATSTAATPSLFNPQFGINTLGISPNVPLMLDTISSKHSKIPECTIQNLIRESNKEAGELGHARYRLADFAFCKYLGKVPNNRMITLRRFANPIGDHIYKWATKKGKAENYSMEAIHDIGRLVSWFDTDDNKLEDICKYEMQMSWKEIKNDIQEIESKEDNEGNRGILGKLLNSINPSYGKFQASDFGGPGHNFWDNIGTKIGSALGISQTSGSDNRELLRMSADDHKVYYPKNTVRDTHLYDGQLTLNQDITLNFSYEMRAYENINPKSAFLDLIGNILEVTYQRGSYWAGGRRFIGAPQNKSGWQTANNLIGWIHWWFSIWFCEFL